MEGRWMDGWKKSENEGRKKGGRRKVGRWVEWMDGIDGRFQGRKKGRKEGRQEEEK